MNRLAFCNKAFLLEALLEDRNSVLKSRLRYSSGFISGEYGGDRRLRSDSSALSQPGRHKLRVMHFQVIEDQNTFWLLSAISRSMKPMNRLVFIASSMNSKRTSPDC